MNMKAFQGGLELLLEPFLLPSLIMGLTWLAKHSWEDHNDAPVLLQILDKLLKPSSSSQETQSMHLAIVTIVATPLFESLQTFLQRNPSNKKAQELSTLLQRAIARLQPLQRDLNCSKTQLETLMRNESNIKRYVAESIKTMMTWSITSSSLGSSPSPAPPFSYKTFAVASQVLTGNVLLDAILAETQNLPPTQLPLALDVITALACAPPSITVSTGTQHGFDTTAKLRSSIQLRCAEIRKLLDRPPHEAETLIQLSRRLETQLAMTCPPTPLNDIPITDLAESQHAADQIMQDFGLNLDSAEVSAAAAAVVADANADLAQQMGIADATGLDQQLNLTSDAATQQQLDDLSAAVAQSNAGAMDIDDAHMFGSMVADLGMPQPDGGLQPDDLTDAVNAEDDIFAGLMEPGEFDLGDDFTF
jgi:mediator of RNA polymerase II transcription subunit 5